MTADRSREIGILTDPGIAAQTTMSDRAVKNFMGGEL
jgi:hypothetical protein